MGIICEHVDGDTSIAMYEEYGTYRVVLSEGEQGAIREERTTSYARAVYEYAQMICFELAARGADEVDRANIESIPHLTPGTW